LALVRPGRFPGSPKEKPMFTVQVYIPVASNEKVTFSTTWHAAFESFLLETIGGYTKLPGTTRGGWVETTDDGRKVVYTDECFVYSLAFASILDTGKLAEIVVFAKRHYRQKAIFIAYFGVAEIL
jgi:hypothetical protein